MKLVTSFGRFWYDFIVGEDWLLAIGIGLLVLTVGLATSRGVNAWWLMPLGLGLLLTSSVFLEARRSTRKRG